MLRILVVVCKVKPGSINHTRPSYMTGQTIRSWCTRPDDRANWWDRCLAGGR